MATTRGVARFHRGRLTKRQQAGALQTLREFQGAVRGRGSAGSLVACCCYGTWAGVEPGPPQASRGRRLCLKLPVPPDGGMASTPSGLGGTRSTASDGGMRSTASLGPGETGASMESLPSGRGGTRPSNGQWRRLSNPSGRLWKAEAGCEVSERSAVVRKRQQAGPLQTLRDLGGGRAGSRQRMESCGLRLYDLVVLLGAWPSAVATVQVRFFAVSRPGVCLFGEEKPAGGKQSGGRGGERLRRPSASRLRSWAQMASAR